MACISSRAKTAGATFLAAVVFGAIGVLVVTLLGSGKPAAGQATVDHIVISPNPATITAGGSQAYTAEAFDGTNNSLGDVTASTTFGIAPDGSCTGATCTATAAGSHTVTGTYDGKNSQASLTVNPGPFDHLVLSPATATITAGNSQTYTAEGFDAHNNSLGDVTASTAFSMSPSGSCTGATCTTNTAGSYTVVGVRSGKVAGASLTVSPGPLDHLVLSPATASITAGGSQAYLAEGRDQFDNSLGDVTASTAFTISPNGSCSGASCGATVAGAHTVTGTKDTKTGSASLTVGPAALHHLVLAPASTTLVSGASQTYTADGRDQFENSRGDVTSSTTFTISPSGSCTAAVCSVTSAGSYTVTGTKDGKTGTTSLVVPLFGSPNPVAAGSPLNVSWFGIASPTTLDWIGLYPSSATPDNSPSRVTFRFTNGAAAGTLPLTVPSATPPGPGFELRLFSNNSYTKLATFGPITVAGTSIAATPTTVTPGQPLSVTWSGVAQPTSTDWFGLYPPGASDNSPSRVTFRFTNGNSFGTLPLQVPANTTPGPNFELRLFSNNSYSRLATFGPITIRAPSITGSPNPVDAGRTLTVSWDGIVAPTTTDWFGLYPPGAGDNSPARVAFRMTNGQTSGTLPMPVPTNAPPASGYELRLFANNTFNRLGAFGPITVNPVPPAALSATPNPVTPGQSLSVTWSDIVAPSSTDWIGLYPSNTTPNDSPQRVTFRFTNGAASGTLPLAVPAATPPGPAYELRLFSNNTYTRLATSAPITLQAPTISAAPTSVGAGQSLSVTWQHIATPTSTDWFGLYPIGVADNSPARVTFRMTDGTANGTLPLLVPAETPPGSNYELRLFANNTYTRLGQPFGPIAVRAPAVTGTPNPVDAGRTLTVSWTDIPAPTSTDWIGLYPSGVGDSSPMRVTFRFTDGARSGSLLMPIPTSAPPGSGYELRLFSNNSYTRLAASAPFTVNPVPQATLSATPNPVQSGQSLEVTWSNIVAPSNTDWVGLYPTDAADDSPSRVTFRFTNGAADGTLQLMVPAGTSTATTYELRLFSNNTYTRLATFGPITVA